MVSYEDPYLIRLQRRNSLGDCLITGGRNARITSTAPVRSQVEAEGVDGPAVSKPNAIVTRSQNAIVT